MPRKSLQQEPPEARASLPGLGRVALVALGLAVQALPASAHDYWLEADKPIVTPAEPVVVRLNFGVGMKVDSEKPFEAASTERFELRYGDEFRDLLRSTREGVTPIFNEPIGADQPYLFSMVRSVTRIEMSGAQFDEYVENEGIRGVRSLRQRERERYWRFLKLLGRSGEQTETDLHHRFTGAQFEIVLLQNPFTAATGEQIAQVLFETKPLAGATVTALHRANDGAVTRLTAVTDQRGVARFMLPQKGTWLFRTVHMRQCRNCDDADWESFWAAYSAAY
jgi:cobalt/nickel transport protein